MVATDVIGKAIEVLQKANQIELVRELIDTQKDVLDLQSTILSLREENINFKQKLDDKSEKQKIQKLLISHSQPYYTKSDDKVKRIYCATCWDKDRNLIQTQTSYQRGHDKPVSNCYICKNFCEVDKDDYEDGKGTNLKSETKLW